MFNPSMTVREIAALLPHSKRVFEKLKIDYCCGGDQLLTDACASAGLPIDQLVGMLKNEEAKPEEDINFSKLAVPNLVTHILYTHHAFTKKELARLDVLVQKVVAAHADNHPELHDLAADFAQLSMDLHPHMFKEEQVLFPYILELAAASRQNRLPAFPPFGTVNNPLRMMIAEHDRAGEMLKQMRNLTNDYCVPSDACISYQTLYQVLDALEKDLHQHIHLENNILFPKASALEAELRA